jgi:hypothetical protein
MSAGKLMFIAGKAMHEVLTFTHPQAEKLWAHLDAEIDNVQDDADFAAEASAPVTLESPIARPCFDWLL